MQWSLEGRCVVFGTIKFQLSCKQWKPNFLSLAKYGQKECGDKYFNRPKRCYDGAVLWELLGTYLLNQL